jgi:hypothetical protein
MQKRKLPRDINARAAQIVAMSTGHTFRVRSRDGVMQLAASRLTSFAVL